MRGIDKKYLATIIFARRYASRVQGKLIKPRPVYEMEPYCELVPTGSFFVMV